MNAALQALSNTEPLTRYLFFFNLTVFAICFVWRYFIDCGNIVHILSEGKKPGLSRTYQALIRDMWMKKNVNGYVTPSGKWITITMRSDNLFNLIGQQQQQFFLLFICKLRRVVYNKDFAPNLQKKICKNDVTRHVPSQFATDPILILLIPYQFFVVLHASYFMLYTSIESIF